MVLRVVLSRLGVSRIACDTRLHYEVYILVSILCPCHTQHLHIHIHSRRTGLVEDLESRLYRNDISLGRRPRYRVDPHLSSTAGEISGVEPIVLPSDLRQRRAGPVNSRSIFVRIILAGQVKKVVRTQKTKRSSRVLECVAEIVNGVCLGNLSTAWWNQWQEDYAWRSWRHASRNAMRLEKENIDRLVALTSGAGWNQWQKDYSWRKTMRLENEITDGMLLAFRCNEILW